MKRKQFLLWLLLLPLLLQSCEKKYPQAETIITGKIVDENDKPMEGVECYFDGLRNLGVSVTFTFQLKTKSDKNGNFTFSQIIPNGTRNARLDIGESIAQRANILKNNTYIDYDNNNIFAYLEIGKTNNIYFKLIKR